MSYGENRLPIDMMLKIAQRARRLRKVLGWSQQELAEKTGISSRSIIRFEKNGTITLESLLRLAFVMESTKEFEGLFPERKTVDELNKLFEQ